MWRLYYHVGLWSWLSLCRCVGLYSGVDSVPLFGSYRSFTSVPLFPLYGCFTSVVLFTSVPLFYLCTYDGLYRSFTSGRLSSSGPLWTRTTLTKEMTGSHLNEVRVGTYYLGTAQIKEIRGSTA